MTSGTYVRYLPMTSISIDLNNSTVAYCPVRKKIIHILHNWKIFMNKLFTILSSTNHRLCVGVQTHSVNDKSGLQTMGI